MIANVQREHRLLPCPLELECAHLVGEAVNEGEHLPRTVTTRLPSAALDLPIVLPQAALRVDGEANVCATVSGRVEAAEEVACEEVFTCCG